jgi:HK97 family phage major capsid protein
MRDKTLHKALRELVKEEKAETMAEIRSTLDKLCQPDTSRIPDEGGGRRPARSAGRTNPAWERAYEGLHRREPELKEWRTPEHDIEARDYLRAVLDNDQAMLREIADRPHNREAAREWARADLAVGTIAAPGTAFGTVPVGFSNVIETIMARAARLTQRVNVVRGGQFAIKIPVQTTKTVAAKHAEAADMATGVTEPVYGSVTPEAVKLGALVKFSRELLDDSPIELLGAVTRDIGEALGTLEDASILDGTTFTNSLFNTLTPFVSPGWTDATESLSSIAAKYYQLDGVFRGRATWIINEAAAEALAVLTGTGERQLFTEFNPTPTAIDDLPGQTGVLMGRPVLVYPTGTVPADEGFFGDLSGYTMYIREPFRAETTSQGDFDTDQVALKVARRVQGIVTQAGRMVLFG